MQLTLRQAIGFALTCLLFAAVGAFALVETWGIWRSGEYLLTARRLTPKLVVQATQSVEFALRCLFLASLGAAMFLGGALGLALLAARFAALRGSFFWGTYEAGRWVRLFWIPLACGGAALALLLVLWLGYD